MRGADGIDEAVAAQPLQLMSRRGHATRLCTWYSSTRPPKRSSAFMLLPLRLGIVVGPELGGDDRIGASISQRPTENALGHAVHG